MSECEIVKMRMQFSCDTLFYCGIFKKAQQTQFMNVVKNRICREKPDRASVANPAMERKHYLLKRYSKTDCVRFRHFSII